MEERKNLGIEEELSLMPAETPTPSEAAAPEAAGSAQEQPQAADKPSSYADVYKRQA